MNKRTIWLVLTCLMVTSLVLVSCNKTTATTLTPTTTSTSTTTTTKITAATTTAPSTTSTTTTAVTGNWWDKLGIPQYGGTMTLRFNQNIVNFDPYNINTLATVEQGWMQRLNADNWLQDPSIFSYKIIFRPNEYTKGWLAESWEFSDPSTYVVHLRQGIHWQNIYPANGREFIADDVVFHYDRLMGLGDGFTKPAPWITTQPNWTPLKSVTATDKYTVIFKWSIANPEFIMETIQGLNNAQDIESPDAVKLWGNVSDWHHAIGTGAFILQDYVSDSSVTLVKNPDYWEYDEHYPQNKLPYVDEVKFLIIPDTATALSAMRTGKIDFMDNIPIPQAMTMQKSNPQILQLGVPLTSTITIDPRNDVKPFSDIKVRIAMQKALDLPTIANSYYFGNVSSPNPSTLNSNEMTGWGFPYNQWPQDLKDEYSYDPTAAKKLLADAGYPNGFKTDVVASTGGDLDLLQIVKSYFASVGIDMEIRPLDPGSWAAFVQNGHKQDALAQRGLAGLLGFNYEPLNVVNQFMTGFNVNWEMVADPVYDAFYPAVLAAPSVDEAKKIVRDANEYVARHHFVISLLNPTQIALYQPWFKGYDGRMYEVSTTSGGPRLFGYYGARLWIDQKLKRSSGF